MGGQTGRQTDGWTNKQAGRKTDRWEVQKDNTEKCVGSQWGEKGSCRFVYSIPTLYIVQRKEAVAVHLGMAKVWWEATSQSILN